jgi:hypothetical protein
LTTEDRSAIGGIVKRVSAAQIRPLEQMQAVDHSHIIALKQHVVGLTEQVVTLTQEVAAIKAAPVQVTVEGEVCREYWPMLDVMKVADVGSPGRRPLVLCCVASIRKWCIQAGRPEAVKLITNDEGADRYVFDIAAVNAWLAAAGSAITDAHKALHA